MKISVTSDRIVAVGLLTERDVTALGKSFRRLYPVEDDGSFDDLLAKLDEVGSATGDLAENRQR